jgi:hypothetical protein
MVGAWPDRLRWARECCVGSNRRVWQRSGGGEGDGRAGCGVPLETVVMQGPYLGEGAGETGECDDQGAAGLAAAMPTRQTPCQ